MLYMLKRQAIKMYAHVTDMLALRKYLYEVTRIE